MEKLINKEIEQQLQTVFQDLENPVEIIFFGSSEDCETCDQTRQLLEEVAALSDSISIRVYDLDTDEIIARQYKIDKAPAFTVVARVGTQAVDYGVKFAGIPAGHEFSSFINVLLMVGKRDSGLCQETRDYLARLKEPLHLQVFFTPT